MTNLPEYFNNALYSLRLPEPFRQIVEAAAIAGRQINWPSDADARDIVKEMVEAIMIQMPSIMHTAGADMEAFSDAWLAFKQNVDDAFEPTTLTQAEIRRAYRNRPTLIAAE